MITNTYTEPTGTPKGWNPFLWRLHLSGNGITCAVVVRHEGGWSVTVGDSDGHFYPGTSAKVYRLRRQAVAAAKAEYGECLPVRIETN